MFKHGKERTERSESRYDRAERNENRKFSAAKRHARFHITKGIKIDYKDAALLQKYISDRGKIISRRITGVSAREQRQLTRAIKQARYLGLLIAGLKRK